jgi:hypothetical protein
MGIAVQGAESQTNKKEKRISWHVVAFLDLLGQQDKLRKLTALPNMENPDEVATFKQEVSDLYRPLYALQTFFNTSIKPWTEATTNENSIMPFERELIQQFQSTPIFYRRISDSLIINIPLHNDIGKFPCRAIFGLLIATAATFFSCMVHSFAIRGGIDLGLGMDIEEGESYGPALARAHNLESRIAQYPRIVIGEELNRYLEAIATNQSLKIEDKAHAMFASKSRELIVDDEDGNRILDWLGTLYRTSFQHPVEQALKVYNFIIQESSKYKEVRNSKLAFRYTLLRNYAEYRLPDWGINFKSE